MQLSLSDRYCYYFQSNLSVGDQLLAVNDTPIINLSYDKVGVGLLLCRERICQCDLQFVIYSSAPIGWS